MSIRCKAICYKVEQDKTEDGQVICERVSLMGVYSEDPASENKWFAKSTPCYSTVLTIENPEAFGTFKEGTEYYVGYEAASVPEPVAAPVAPAPIDLGTDAAPTPQDEVPPAGLS